MMKAHGHDCEFVTSFCLIDDHILYHGLRTHDGSIPNSLQPKFKSQSQINKTYFLQK